MRVTASGATFSPSDLNDFLECEHLVALELNVARGERERPEQVDHAQAALIQRKGEEHELAYLEALRSEGRSGFTRSGPSDCSLATFT